MEAAKPSGFQAKSQEPQGTTSVITEEPSGGLIPVPSLIPTETFEEQLAALNLPSVSDTRDELMLTLSINTLNEHTAYEQYDDFISA